MVWLPLQYFLGIDSLTFGEGMMNIVTLTKYGAEQALELERAFMSEKLTRKEYREEIVLLANEGSIRITE